MSTSIKAAVNHRCASPCWGCHTPDHCTQGTEILYGADNRPKPGRYCEDCAQSRRVHAFFSATGISTYCGRVVRKEEDRSGKRREADWSDKSLSLFLSTPNACQECGDEIATRKEGWAA